VSEQQLETAPVETAIEQPVAEPSDFALQIEALRSKNAELIGERRRDKEAREALQSRLEEIETAQKTAQQQQLEQSGEFRTLWEEAQKTNADLRTQLLEREQKIGEIQTNYSREQLKARAISDLSAAGALAPDQLYRLVQDELQSKDGTPVAIKGGVEVALAEYVAGLRNPGSGYEHHFAAQNRAGMGAATAPRPSALPGTANPFRRETWNITEQVRLLAESPDVAKLLKAEATP
jgi:predicted RNase H-like nuclease (RuvC/YqgF family)